MSAARRCSAAPGAVHDGQSSPKCTEKSLEVMALLIVLVGRHLSATHGFYTPFKMLEQNSESPKEIRLFLRHLPLR